MRSLAGRRQRRAPPVLAKGKVTPVLISDAKKKSGGTTVIKGACCGEDGKLVFEMAIDPPATMEAALKKVIHEETGITQVCICRRGTNPDLVDDDAPKQSPPTAPPKTPTSTQGTPPQTKPSGSTSQTPRSRREEVHVLRSPRRISPRNTRR